MAVLPNTFASLLIFGNSLKGSSFVTILFIVYIVILKELYRLALVNQFVRFFHTIVNADIHRINDCTDLLFGYVAVFIASVVYYFMKRFSFQRFHIVHILLADTASWFFYPITKILLPVLPCLDFDYYHSCLHFELSFQK
nr:MAG TPA: hypothetical protein [Caudoviricetes sp.]